MELIQWFLVGSGIGAWFFGSTLRNKRGNDY